MTHSNDYVRRHGGQANTVAVLEQKAVAPIFSMDRHFFRAQARLKRNPAVRRSAQPAVGPLFTAEWDYDYLNIPTAMRRKIERMVQNYRATDAERMAQYAQRATQRFYEQEAAA